MVSVVCFVEIFFLTGYLENYGPDKQHIILLHVYSSLNNVKQSSTDSDSEGKMQTSSQGSLLPVPMERENLGTRLVRWSRRSFIHGLRRVVP